jgi:flagellar hook-associated protein 3 FlgL
MNSVQLSREHGLYTAFSDRAIQARQRELARLSEQIGTGKRVNRASDDPSSFAQARRMDVLTERYTQYQRSIDAARSWTDSTQKSLDDLAELFTRAHEAGLRASNGSLNASDGEIIAKELEALYTEVLDTLNTKSGEEYLFAGSRTTVTPFTEDGVTGEVEYNGNANGRKRTIGHDLSMNINISGDRIHDTGAGYTITESLQNLIDSIRAGDPAAVSTALGQVEQSRDHVVDLGAEAGTLASRLSLAEDQLTDAMLTVESRRSELEDADVAELFMLFQKEQTGLTAALQSAASILQTSIMDYLR